MVSLILISNINSKIRISSETFLKWDDDPVISIGETFSNLPRFLIPLEISSGEKRVAASPETVKKLIALGCHVTLEVGAGLSAGFLDQDYKIAGADLVSKGDSDPWRKTDVLLCVNPPPSESLLKMKQGALLIGLLEPYGNIALAKTLEKGGFSAFALELLPRISRAQSADVLSSQGNIAGYKSVLLAAGALDRYFPMLMTAAGTVQPAKIVVLGAGVAGLQAVATARRLGAVVFVSDIRPAVKEQVESLGARFINLPDFQDNPSESGGYAKQASEAFLSAQRQQLSDHLAEADVAICTAQVPGKKAPRLITEEMLDRMRIGSVVVDLAVEQGGNCAGTRAGETVDRKGVKLIGASDLPSTVPNHASSLYARNLLALVEPLVSNGELTIDSNDELIDGCMISFQGDIRHPEVFSFGGAH